MKTRNAIAQVLGLAMTGACFSSSVVAVTSYNDGETVPAFVQQYPTGSQDDLRTQAVYNADAKTWTLTFRRNLTTGDTTHDVQFALGGTYSFQLATFDHTTGTDTALDSNNVGHLGNKETIYTVTIPPALPATATGKTALTFSAVPAKLIPVTGISGNLLGSNEIEITMVWSDQTKDDTVGHRTYTVTNAKKKLGKWSDATSTDQDQVAVIWDVQNNGFAETGNCSQMCHQGDFAMATEAGTVDSWQWQAATSGPIAHAVDGYWDQGASTNPNGRHEDAGLPPYVANDLMLNGNPKFQGENQPGATAATSPTRLFLLPAGTKPAVKPATFPTEGWIAGNVLPPSVYRPIRGNTADVRSFASHNGKEWTVTFRRKLDTGGDRGHDIKFEKGKDYYFLYAYHNNSDHDYSEGADHELCEPEKPHTMHIPDAVDPVTGTADLEITADPTSNPNPTAKEKCQVTSVTGKLLASDELEITFVWPDASRNDNKRRWTYNPTNATPVGTDPWTRVKPYSTGTYNADPALSTYQIVADETERAKREFSSDRFQLIWDMQGDRFETTGNCQDMCHTDPDPTVRAMKTNAGILDGWNWTGNSLVSGYPSDTYWDTTGDSVSDVGSQSATTGNTGTKSDTTAPAGTDLNVAKLTYTAEGGAGVSAEYLYADSPQADGWARGNTSFIQKITAVKLNNKLSKKGIKGKDSITITGVFDEGDAYWKGKNASKQVIPAEFDPTKVLTNIKIGSIVDLSIPAGQFTSKLPTLYTYASKGANGKPDKKVKILLKAPQYKNLAKAKPARTFTITLTQQQDLSTLTLPADFTFRVGSFDGSPKIQ